MDDSSYPNEHPGNGHAPMMAKRILGREEILSVADTQTEEVEVPEWGGWVIVKGMRGDEWDAFQNSLVKGKMNNRRMDLDNFHARLVARCVVDEQGKRLFTPYDVEALGKKSAAALKRVADVASRLSGIRDEDIEDFTEDLKNDPFVASGSD